MIRSRALSMAVAALIGLALPSVGVTDSASAKASKWHTVHEEASEVIQDVCPGLTVLWEITADTRWRYIRVGRDQLPLRLTLARDAEVYTNVTSGKWVTVTNKRSELPLHAADNGDGTLTSLWVHTDYQVMRGQDGKPLAKLRTGWILIEKTFDQAGTPTDPSDDEVISVRFPHGTESSGHNANFCTELTAAIG